MFIDGNKEENANGSSIWLDAAETTWNNNSPSRVKYILTGGLWEFVLLW